jgi:thiamine biosynthesis lipoprotein
MKRAVFPAMGTSIDVTATTDRGIESTRRLFETVEDACSRFRPESELSLANNDARRIVPVSPLLAGVLRAAEHARAVTGGLVDAGLGEAVLAWGYDRSFGSLDTMTDREAPTLPAEPEWSTDGSALVRTPGTSIDLGGIAKGWAGDLAIERGHARIVSAGGDVRSVAADAGVQIVDPWGDVLASIRVGVGAIATSSVARRRWRFGDGEAHHLIDPRTMRPSEGPILQATAITSTAAEAEAAAKAIVLLGVDGLAWADRQAWIRGALAVWSNGCAYGTTGLEMAA